MNIDFMAIFENASIIFIAGSSYDLYPEETIETRDINYIWS